MPRRVIRTVVGVATTGHPLHRLGETALGQRVGQRKAAFLARSRRLLLGAMAASEPGSGLQEQAKLFGMDLMEQGGLGGIGMRGSPGVGVWPASRRNTYCKSCVRPPAPNAGGVQLDGGRRCGDLRAQKVMRRA